MPPACTRRPIRVARKIKAAAGADGRRDPAKACSALNPQDFVDGSFGLPTVQDIIAELEKPGRDPRPAFAAATFSEGIEKISDLVPGMVLEGTVTNVAAFGAFVDVGVHQDGLVHVSALANRFVSDPREVVKSGQVVRVKVLEADPERKRISLTLRLDDEPAPSRNQQSQPRQPNTQKPTEQRSRSAAARSTEKPAERRSAAAAAEHPQARSAVDHVTARPSTGDGRALRPAGLATNAPVRSPAPFRDRLPRKRYRSAHRPYVCLVSGP